MKQKAIEKIDSIMWIFYYYDTEESSLIKVRNNNNGSLFFLIPEKGIGFLNGKRLNEDSQIMFDV